MTLGDIRSRSARELREQLRTLAEAVWESFNCLRLRKSFQTHEDELLVKSRV